ALASQRFDIFARAASRILRSRSVRLWIPCAEILSSIGSTSRLMNSAGGRSSASLELSFRQNELLAERVVTNSRRGNARRKRGQPNRGTPRPCRHLRQAIPPSI